MALGWFDAIASSVMPIASGLRQGAMQGRLARAEEERKRREEALQRQLLEARLADLQRPQKWEPTTMEEAQAYELGIHPERSEQPDRATPTEWEKAGFQDQESYLRYLGQKSRAEYPDRFRAPRPTATDRSLSQRTQNEEAEGLAILGGTGDPKVIGPFGQAYQAVRAQNPTMQPGLVAKRALAGLKSSRPDLFRSSGGGFVNEFLNRSPADTYTDPDRDPAELPEPPTPTPAAPPTTSPAEEAVSAGAKRVITQDQADFLKAKGRWDPALYEVR